MENMLPADHVTKPPHLGRRYRHYKGGLYEFVSLADHTENHEPLVVYRHLESQNVYARPAAIFFGRVNTTPNETTLRFQPLPPQRTHRLKTWPEHFEPLRTGAKTHELRLDDRGFNVGDTLVLEEWKPDTKEYTGRVLQRRVTHITRNFAGLQNYYCIMSLTKEV